MVVYFHWKSAQRTQYSMKHTHVYTVYDPLLTICTSVHAGNHATYPRRLHFRIFPYHFVFDSESVIIDNEEVIRPTRVRSWYERLCAAPDGGWQVSQYLRIKNLNRFRNYILHERDEKLYLRDARVSPHSFFCCCVHVTLRKRKMNPKTAGSITLFPQAVYFLNFSLLAHRKSEQTYPFMAVVLTVFMDERCSLKWTTK